MLRNFRRIFGERIMFYKAGYCILWVGIDARYTFRLSECWKNTHTKFCNTFSEKRNLILLTDDWWLKSLFFRLFIFHTSIILWINHERTAQIGCFGWLQNNTKTAPKGNIFAFKCPGKVLMASFCSNKQPSVEP